MPIPVCRRTRAERYTEVHDAQYAGKYHAKNERSFGWKLHLTCDRTGILARFVVRPAHLHDTTKSMIWPARYNLGHCCWATAAM